MGQPLSHSSSIVAIKAINSFGEEMASIQRRSLNPDQCHICFQRFDEENNLTYGQRVMRLVHAASKDTQRVQQAFDAFHSTCLQYYQDICMKNGYVPLTCPWCRVRLIPDLRAGDSSAYPAAVVKGAELTVAMREGQMIFQSTQST
jgi:hypothetical protein